MDYQVVIGLEVHVQLKTKSKAFCSCSTEFGLAPNTSVCPVCLGLPGSLPVLNRFALEFAIKVSLALNCQIQRNIRFDRKNYFYPDLPKNYQISQYALPIGKEGFLEIEPQEGIKNRIGIKRVHLEEDAGKLIHTQDYSLVDFNRAGIPLLEIVSYPEISSPDLAYEYLITLKELLSYLDVSDCDMEKGSLRCDANISLKKKEAKELGVKVELQNMNSFKAVKDALSYEVKRQAKILKENRSVIQETRLWDPKEGRTISMRTKEEAQDYRYFPDPDLVPFVLDEEIIERIKESLPVLPHAVREKLKRDFGLTFEQAKFIASEKKLAEYFQSCMEFYPQVKSVYNWLAGPLMAEINERKIDWKDLKISPQEFIGLIKLVDERRITQLKAKEILKKMFTLGKSYLSIIEEEGVSQISDLAYLKGIVKEVIEANPKVISDYKEGKTNALMFLVGQVMKKTNKNADPKIVQELLKESIEKS